MLKKIGILVLLSTLITGCSASPQFLRGHYYMTGDSNCRYSRALTDTSIECYNSDDELTGYRDAMTNQQLEMYRHNEQMKQQRSIALQQQYDQRYERRPERMRDDLREQRERIQKSLGMW